LFTNPIQISTSQLNKYKRALTRLPHTYISMTNNRPVQPLNGRTVEFGMDVGGWTYDTNEATYAGPAAWASMPDSACGSTVRQTPIDLPEAPEGVMNAYSDLALSAVGECKSYYLGKVNEHTWKAENICSGGGKFNMVFEGVTYRMLQFHFHSPSEHTIDGK
jgi:carbonic anhydrase